MFDPKHEQPLEALEERLRGARTITPELIAEVVAQSCTRFRAQSTAAKATVIRLIESGAWTDAILTLLALELPQWTLRRLVREDSVWICALSRHPELPLPLDDLAEAHHELLPLALLMAFVQARRASAATAVRGATVPRLGLVLSGQAVCCDNFV